MSEAAAPQRLRFSDGLLHIDGQPTAHFGADYPYYRDRPERWGPKLRRLAEAGVNVVTCYVPWRHHEQIGREGGIEWVFTARRPGDNRDLRRFLQLAAECGLAVILKPGPFVHGEITYGGLPDRLSPQTPGGPEPLRCRDGSTRRYQGFALPAPLDPYLRREADRWLEAVRREVLADQAAPHGPVIALQPWNEGVYSDANVPEDRADASTAAETARLQAGASPAAWASGYLEAVWGIVGAATRHTLPLVANVPPPSLREPAAVDAWLGRCEVSRWGGVGYGFSSWMGNVLDDDLALASLLLAAGWWPGPQMEENWGFVWHDPRYACGVIQAHHAVAALAAGATGLTAYPGCATDAPSPQVQLSAERCALLGAEAVLYEQPYGRVAAVGVGGGDGPLWSTLALVGGWLRTAGSSLARARPQPAVALVVDPERAAASACGGEDQAGPASLVTTVLYETLRRGRIAQVVPFGSPHLPPPGEVPLLVAASDLPRIEADRRALEKWVRAGGRLVVLEGDARRAIARLLPPSPNAGRTVAGRRVDPGSGITSVFVLNRSDHECEHHETVAEIPLRLRLVAGGSAVVQVCRRRIVSALWKGYNEISGETAPLDISYGEHHLACRIPGDARWDGRVAPASFAPDSPAHDGAARGYRIDAAAR